MTIDSWDLQQKIEAFEEELLEIFKELPKVSFGDVGLDKRAGEVGIGEGFIVTYSSSAAYYSGLSYVSDDYKKEYENFVLYFVDPDQDECRVQSIIYAYAAGFPPNDEE